MRSSLVIALLACAACGGSRGAIVPEDESEPREVMDASDEETGEDPLESSVETVEESEPKVDPAADPRAALLAGVAAGEEGRWGEAIELFAAVLAAAPTWSTAHMEMAHALLMTGGDPGVIGQHVEQARLLDRDNARLHYIEGLLMEETRRPAMAAAAYERAAEIRPSLLDARLRLGRLLLQEGHIEDAIEHLEASVRLDPGLLPARANLASAYEAAGRIDDAADQLEAITRLFPENVFHLQRLAAFYEKYGRHAEAGATLRRAEALEPSEQRRMRPLPPSRR